VAQAGTRNDGNTLIRVCQAPRYRTKVGFAAVDLMVILEEWLYSWPPGFTERDWPSGRPKLRGETR
jgi:hypothetical protein